MITVFILSQSNSNGSGDNEATTSDQRKLVPSEDTIPPIIFGRIDDLSICFPSNHRPE